MLWSSRRSSTLSSTKRTQNDNPKLASSAEATETRRVRPRESEGNSNESDPENNDVLELDVAVGETTTSSGDVTIDIYSTQPL